MSVEITEIIFTGKEGEDGEWPITVSTFADANARLSRWARNAPTGGAYDKVWVTFKGRQNGQPVMYHGRVDLTQSHAFDLASYMVKQIAWLLKLDKTYGWDSQNNLVWKEAFEKY